MMKKLPIGTQSFSTLRSEGYLYVDKTEYIHKMVASGRVYFLSRPRRFGKSLLVSTLNALFSGRKELFEGLYIYDKWDWTKQRPIIQLDFTGLTFGSTEELNRSLSAFITETAARYGLSLPDVPTTYRFGLLIRKIHEATGEKVVVLIDEYDKPIIDHLSTPEVMESNKTTLHNFYQVLKATDENSCFIFLTGVSRFSGLSIFSALNNLDDITISGEYASICGYTQEELERCFAEHIDEVARYNSVSKADLLDSIREWYNGYSWDGKTSVYNPFSTLLFFKNREFDSYWFGTGTPTFLIDLLKRHNKIGAMLQPVVVDASAFQGYDTVDVDETTLLFQTGYLTVKRKERMETITQYTLDVPNMEVKNAFLKYLLSAYSNYPVGKVQPLLLDMQQQLRSGDTAGLEQNLRMLLANIPHTLHIPKEAYYHSLFLTWMRMLGFDIQGEILTNIGRIDAVWRQPEMVVVAEVKYHANKNIDKLLEDAIAQINDRCYHEAYRNQPVLLMAVAFTGKEVKCKLRKIN
jgi:hypothetical protein